MATIADRAVLVTGANRGIGRALVEEALRAVHAPCTPGRAGPPPIPTRASGR